MELSAIVTGCALCTGGVALGLRQMLSGPDRPNYPTVGPKSRALMFWTSGFLIIWGVNAIAMGQPVSAYGLTGSLLIAGHFGNSLYNHLTQRASVRTHRLIDRLHRMARCAPSDGLVNARTSAMAKSTGAPCPSASVVPEALLALSLDGVRVSAPNEGPEAFTGPWR